MVNIKLLLFKTLKFYIYFFILKFFLNIKLINVNI